jgi:protein O-GlcNAc transferase
MGGIGAFAPVQSVLIWRLTGHQQKANRRMTPAQSIEQGLRLHQAGRLAEAEKFYAAALTAEPQSFQALHLMGLLRFHQQNFVVARALLEQALARQPDAPDTLLYYGATLAALGLTDAALPILARAVAAAPNEAAKALALASRGDIYLELERPIEALADFDRAVTADPNFIPAWNNRGLVLSALKRPMEALACFDRVIALAPRSVEAHNNRSDALRELRRYDEALAGFARALAINPQDFATLNNRAVALTYMQRRDEALADYDKALAIEPGSARTLFARGNLLWSHKAALVPAIADLQRAVTLAPDTAFTRGSLMRLKMAAADWSDFPAQKTLLDAGVRAGRAVIEPFIYLALSDDPADLHKCAQTYARSRFPAQPVQAANPSRRPGRIRIGYVCGEFRTNATLYLMAGLFEAHDKSQFEIIAFDNGGGDASPLRARFEAAVEKIVDINGLSDAEAAARIRDEAIDILVDLNGYSGNQRVGIFSHRPAPRQVEYLAYAGTLGTDFMDYILADKIVIPETEAAHYSEKIAWLPYSYQVNDDKRAIAKSSSRAEAGLPEQAFVFCNFNHVGKFTPASFSRWLRLLGEIPGSVLWLLRPDAIAARNLAREAQAQGIDPGRLVFAETMPFEKHLARLALADLFLDGLPYGAHTTASDALWAGLPLITCRGKSFAGRVAASLLTALEMPELITETESDFEALALRLARQPQSLAALRVKLADKRRTAPLFDTVRNTRAIEAAYHAMLGKIEPENFAVP